MLKQIIFIFLVLFAFGNQSAMAAGGSEEGVPVSSLKTENSLLFKIGKIYVLGTQHDLPIDIFPETVTRFFADKRDCKHLVEECFSGESDLIAAGIMASKVEDSVIPHLEEIKKALPDGMKATLEMILAKYPPKYIKPWAAIALSWISLSSNQSVSNGMDPCIEAIFSKIFPLETTLDRVDAMGLPKMSPKELLEVFASESLPASTDMTTNYLSGDLGALEKNMDIGCPDIVNKARKPRNINFAKNTLKYMDEGAKDEVFFAAMGSNHLLGEYGYLNLMSALLGEPLLRFDDSTGEFVPRETYLDSFTAGRPALLEGLRAQGIVPQV